MHNKANDFESIELSGEVGQSDKVGLTNTGQAPATDSGVELERLLEAKQEQQTFGWNATLLSILDRLAPRWLQSQYVRLTTHDEDEDEEHGEQLELVDSDDDEASHAILRHSVSKRRPAGQWVPEDRATWLSKLFFLWMDGLMTMGVKRPLEQADLWDVSSRDSAAQLANTFQEVLELKHQGIAATAWAVHGRRFVWVGVLKLLHDIVMLSVPLLLQQLLLAVERDASTGVTLGLACAMAAASLMETLSVNVYFHLLYRMGLHLKVALVTMLYRKTLRISNTVKSTMGVGAIVNLQSNDAAKLWGLPQYMHVLWSGPFQILVVMAMLTRVIHFLPALAGLAMTMTLVPCSIWLGKVLNTVRKQLIVKTDARVKLCSEVATGIKAIKLYAWEKPYTERIVELRADELKSIRQAAVINIASYMTWQAGPVLISLVSFGTYTLMGYPLTAAVAFPALALFNQLRFPVAVFPEQLSKLIQAHVALKRLQGFMQSEEMVQPALMPVARPGQFAIDLHHASFNWQADAPQILQDVTLQVLPGQLVVVVGDVGSGKSSLLAALMGEMHTMSGECKVLGRISYTAQDPWIQTATLRNNVLMGDTFKAQQYWNVLEVCALAQDLETLPAADLSEIGEKGINLSGGQRHRVALARACYADGDVYLLDDPLSAVDAHVGKHLFDRCICEHLAGKTRILATHQLQYLPGADLIVVLHGGKVMHTGTYEQLVEQGVDFKQFAQPVANEPADVAEAPSTTSFSTEATPVSMTPVASHADVRQAALPRDQGQPLHNGVLEHTNRGNGTVNDVMGDSDEDTDEMTPFMSAQPFPAMSDQTRNDAHVNGAKTTENLPKGISFAEDTKAESPGLLLSKKLSMANSMKLGGRYKLVKSEERAVGSVDRQLYSSYLRSWGPYMLLPGVVIAACGLERGCRVVQDWWLAHWSKATAASQYSGSQLSRWPYLGAYVAFACIAMGLQFCRQYTLVIGTTAASRKMHATLLNKMMRLPMSFFDSQPSGRLLNRFTRDMEAVDIKLPGTFNSALNCVVSVLASLVVVCAVSPGMIFFLAALALVYIWLQQRYIAVSREVKRLDSIAFSPIFSTFGETAQGLVTIRALRKQSTFEDVFFNVTDNSSRSWWPCQCVNRWLSVRLELIGLAVVFGSALFVSVVQQRSAGLAGLAITSALNLTGLMNWMVRQVSELEVEMNSVERLLEYDTYQTEKPAIVPSKRPPAQWPTAGAIIASDLVVRYRPELEPVLKGISFSIAAEQKVGIVGRTGCGKSTLLMALYRIVEPCSGTIVIDNVDITTIGLQDLRSRLALVPQDPVIFSGTVRSNLDPWGEAPNDAALWECLSQAGMRDTVQQMQGGLDAPLSEGGCNLSTGQRQLLCMARALVRHARILVLDEATSNVDTATDALIQATIRSAFAHCTVLTVAHRLHTIMDSDIILCLAAGKVEELDTPANLLAQPEGLFARLVSQSLRHRSKSGYHRSQSAVALAAALPELQ